MKNDGHFHWGANLPHFHACKSTCLVFILKPCDITCVFHCLQTMWNHSRFGVAMALILLIFDQLVGCDSWYGRAKEHTWLIVQPWKGLNSTTNCHLEKSLNLVLVFEKYLISLLGHKKSLKFTTLSTPDTFFFKIRLIFAEENSAHPWCKN